MTTRAALLSVILCSLSFAEDNFSITQFKTVNEMFHALGKCGNQPVKPIWEDLLVKKHITPCKPQKSLEYRQIPAGDSGILSDGQKFGERSINQQDVRDCKFNDYTFRFTYDRVFTKNGFICGFEVFIRKPNHEIIGFALNDKGEILKDVPSDLAFDKHGNKEFNAHKKNITSGLGCFECHPSVSSIYDMPNQKKFWKDASYPRFKKEETSPRNSGASTTHQN